ncbi:MAG: hypothetical protein RIF36_09500 [Imperialibacter sp.]|uniref:hypothetical protein n=1 Tax=Imperialibacter sp. TaxID=2038411 RepID=UPI0032EB58F1
MAHLVKVKLGIVAFSIFTLVFMHLHESQFNTIATYTRWTQVGWEHFHGWAKPFTGWAAGISSEIYLEYDSAKQSWHAYAAMNNLYSWVAERNKNSNDLLLHEQYHFNISEVHSRMLNDYIAKNPEQSEHDYKLKLSALRSEKNAMQDDYDTEGGHNLISDWQARWEYKIDSMLQAYAGDSGITIDYYAGAKIFFPSLPHFFGGINSANVAYRIFQLDKYDVSLAISLFQQPFGIDSLNIDTLKKNYYDGDSLVIRVATLESINGFPAYRFVAYDSSSNETHHHLWTQNNDFRYKLTLDHDGDTAKTAGYYDMASSFFRGFSLFNADPYWMDLHSRQGETISWSGPMEDPSPEDKNSNCFVFEDNAKHSFYRGPIFLDDGSFIMAYDVLQHSDSLVKAMIMIANNQVYSYDKKEGDFIFTAPAERLSSSLFEVSFGYLLEKDSLAGCEPFYYEQIVASRNTTSQPLDVALE